MSYLASGVRCATSWPKRPPPAPTHSHRPLGLRGVLRMRVLSSGDRSLTDNIALPRDPRPAQVSRSAAGRQQSESGASELLQLRLFKDILQRSGRKVVVRVPGDGHSAMSAKPIARDGQGRSDRSTRTAYSRHAICLRRFTGVSSRHPLIHGCCMTPTGPPPAVPQGRHAHDQ